MVSQTISHYHILKKLGEGGMGEVYLAQDTKLDRVVALKLLPAEVASDPKSMRRFVQEAKAASAFSHPNVCVIHEVGETEEGRPFMAMEYVEGQALDAKIGGHPLDVAEIVEVGLQVADALDAAHSKGITHRDIKPSNIMITSRGQVKVLDFGLAKVARSTEQALGSDIATQAKTEPGVLLGTVQYMSPEQALGREVDHRTDIFSTGVMLYEMATGHRPFTGTTVTETIDRIVHSQPDAIVRFNYNVPAEFERIVRKCLEKAPERRYQSARDLLVDLRNLQRERDSGTRAGKKVTAPPWNNLRRSAFAALALVIFALVGVALYLLVWPDRAIDSLAVLPFANESADPSMEYLSDGITESLINSLSQLPHLRVIARSSVFRYKGRPVDPQAVGRDLKVRAVLTGRVAQRGNALFISAEFVDAWDNSLIWGEQYNRKLSDILAAQEEISREISERLRLKLSGEEQKRLTKRYTENTEAYQLYLKGRYYWNKRTEEDLRRSIEFFHQAIEEDPNYALAYAGLADSYLVLGDHDYLVPKEAYPPAKEAAMKALEIDDTLAEAHTSLAFARLYYDWDWVDAKRGFKRAIELKPGYATAHHWYGNALIIMSQSQEGMAHLQQAQELDPLSLIIDVGVGVALYYARQYDQAIEQFRKTLEMDPNFAAAHSWRGRAYEQKGRYEEAIAELQKAITLSEDTPVRLTRLGHVYAVSGQRVEAQQVLDQLKELSKRRYVSPYHTAVIYTGLGEKDQPFAWLEKAYEERSSQLVYLKVDPIFDNLHSDPRFSDLLRRVGLH